MKLTFEGTEEQLDLLKDEFDMLLIEHGDEKLPSIDSHLFHYRKKTKIIASMLFDIFQRIQIDRPDNFDEILNFVVDDVDETADRFHWHDGDVAIAFRRYIESKDRRS